MKGGTSIHIKEEVARQTGEKQCKDAVLEVIKEASISRMREGSSESNAHYRSFKRKTQTWPSDLVM